MVDYKIKPSKYARVGKEDQLVPIHYVGTWPKGKVGVQGEIYIFHFLTTWPSYRAFYSTGEKLILVGQSTSPLSCIYGMRKECRGIFQPSYSVINWLSHIDVNVQKGIELLGDMNWDEYATFFIPHGSNESTDEIVRKAKERYQID